MRFQRKLSLAFACNVLSIACLAVVTQAEPAKSAPDGTLLPVANDKKRNTGLNKAAGLDVSKPYGYHLQPILDRIKADDQQRKKISDIVQSYKSKIQPLRDEYKQKRQEFLSSMFGGGAAETIMSRQMELSHLSSDITSKYCMMRLEIRRILSPQQILLYESYSREQGWNR